MAAKAIIDLTINQGETFSLSIPVGRAYNGQVVKAQIRCSYGGPGTPGQLIQEFTTVPVTGGIAVISLTAAQTAALTSPISARCDENPVQIGDYDVTSTPDTGTTVTRHRQGRAFLDRAVTE